MRTSHLLILLTLLSSCNTNKYNTWSIINFTDEFGEKQSSAIGYEAFFRGKMENNISGNDDLTINVQIEDTTVRMIFYEYNKNIITQLPENEFVNARIKLSNNEIKDIQMFCYQNRLFDAQKGELLKLILSQNKPVKIFINLYQINTKYNFEIDPIGLKNILKMKR